MSFAVAVVSYGFVILPLGVLMDVISDQEAIEALERHFRPLLELMRGGWSDYQALSPAIRAAWTTTTRAGVVHDFQVVRASNYASRTEGIRIAESSKLRLLVIDDRYAIRLKKFDETLMPSNHFTQQVRDFRGQRQIPGLPETCNLELGYVLDRGESEIAKVCLALPNGPHLNMWAIDLSTIESVGQQRVFDFADHKTIDEGAEQDESAAIVPKRDSTVVPFKRESDET